MAYTTKSSEKVGKQINVLCQDCNRKTLHCVLAAVEYRGQSDDSGAEVWGSAQVIQCRGCEAIGFRDAFTSSEVDDPFEYLYPPRILHRPSVQLLQESEIYKIPRVVQTIYCETREAVDHHLPTLAGIGVRAILEAICKDRGTTKAYLKDKIDELVGMSLLTADGAKILHGIRWLGNDAAHDFVAPTDQQIAASIKVIDHLLLGVYIIPTEAKCFPQRSTPKAP